MAGGNQDARGPAQAWAILGAPIRTRAAMSPYGRDYGEAEGVQGG